MALPPHSLFAQETIEQQLMEAAEGLEPGARLEFLELIREPGEWQDAFDTIGVTPDLADQIEGRLATWEGAQKAEQAFSKLETIDDKVERKLGNIKDNQARKAEKIFGKASKKADKVLKKIEKDQGKGKDKDRDKDKDKDKSGDSRGDPGGSGGNGSGGNGNDKDKGKDKDKKK